MQMAHVAGKMRMEKCELKLRMEILNCNVRMHDKILRGNEGNVSATVDSVQYFKQKWNIR